MRSLEVLACRRPLAGHQAGSHTMLTKNGNKKDPELITFHSTPKFRTSPLRSAKCEASKFMLFGRTPFSLCRLAACHFVIESCRASSPWANALSTSGQLGANLLVLDCTITHNDVLPLLYRYHKCCVPGSASSILRQHPAATPGRSYPAILAPSICRPGYLSRSHNPGPTFQNHKESIIESRSP